MSSLMFAPIISVVTLLVAGHYITKHDILGYKIQLQQS